MDKNGQLTPQQERAIELLLAGTPRVGTAEQVGIARSTLYTWLKNPTFRQELRDRQAAALEEAMAALAAAAWDLVTVIIGLAQADDTPAAVRLQAARGGLADLLRMRESLELEERLAALEDEIHERKS
jgi:hypothetical protein